ncbi:MAG TPA: hypothetical protein VGM93_15315, partial [Acidimicrobiales bacterium]
MTGIGPASRSLGRRAYTQVLERAVLPAGDLALRTEFMRELRRWRQLERCSAGALAAEQRAGLEGLLHHATTVVPYYRDLRITRSSDPFEWLRRFPILTKAHLRDHGDVLRTPGLGGLVKIS